MKIDYIPTTKDIDNINLLEELNILVEALAENVHEVWAKSRMEQGWKVGPERNDQLKQHPCLIPYSELSEEEKDYDRNTAMNTLKLIEKLGFTIIKENK